MKIVHCPTKLMSSDTLTKSLGGNLFYTHHNTIMGIDSIKESKYVQIYSKARNKARGAQAMN